MVGLSEISGQHCRAIARQREQRRGPTAAAELPADLSVCSHNAAALLRSCSMRQALRTVEWLPRSWLRDHRRTIKNQQRTTHGNAMRDLTPRLNGANTDLVDDGRWPLGQKPSKDNTTRTHPPMPRNEKFRRQSPFELRRARNSIQVQSRQPYGVVETYLLSA